MAFQNAPTPLNRVVLAVIRRLIHQLDCHLVPVHKVHQAFQELGPGTGDFRAVVQFDVQALDTWVGHFPFAPPEIQAIGQEVACLAGMTEQKPRLVNRHRSTVQFQDAEGHQHRLRGHVVIESLDRTHAARLATTGEVTDFHFCLGIQRNYQRVRVGCRLDPGLLDVGEDGVRLGNFF